MKSCAWEQIHSNISGVMHLSILLITESTRTVCRSDLLCFHESDKWKKPWFDWKLHRITEKQTHGRKSSGTYQQWLSCIGMCSTCIGVFWSFSCCNEQNNIYMSANQISPHRDYQCKCRIQGNAHPTICLDKNTFLRIRFLSYYSYSTHPRYWHRPLLLPALQLDTVHRRVFLIVFE